MRISVATAVAALLLSAGGCGASTPQTAVTPAPSVVTVTAPAPVASTTPTCPVRASDVEALSRTYVLVDASRGGEGDHKKWVEKFYEDAERLTTRFNDSCPEALEANAAAAGVTYQASVLNAAVVITDDDAEPGDYKDTVEAGQELFDAVGITDTEFGEDVLGQ